MPAIISIGTTMLWSSMSSVVMAMAVLRCVWSVCDELGSLFAPWLTSRPTAPPRRAASPSRTASARHPRRADPRRPRRPPPPLARARRP
eukprot:7385742-Prymnesium_polylepis.1